MEIPVITEVPGVVRELDVEPGQTVQEGDRIALDRRVLSESPPRDHFEERGHVGVATIDRQERRNASERRAVRRSCAVTWRQSGELRAIVITGAGTAFCCGRRPRDPLRGRRRRAPPTPSARRSRSCSTRSWPTRRRCIAAINGPAIGAGMQLAVACDLRVAAPGARLAIPGGKLGIHLSAAQHLAARPARRAGRGPRLPAGGAHGRRRGGAAPRAGAVRRRTTRSAAALALAGEIAASAPLTVRGHKRALNLVAEARVAR